MDKIVEIGGYAAGYCGRLFAQSGHDVVRVDTGERDPAYVSREALKAFLDGGKQIIETSNAALIRRLVEEADVIILDADCADSIDNWNLDEWPSAVKIAITPFGRTGPHRNWQATSSTLLAMGGFTFLMGDADREPLTLPGHFVDFQSGAFAYSAAQACRHACEPNTIDISKLEVVMALSQFTTVMWHCANIVRSRHGNDFWSVVPTNMFECKDGWVYINIVPGFWDPFVAFLELPELVLDERFITNARRMHHREALHEITRNVLIGLTRSEIQLRAVECRIPLGSILTFDEVLDDEHLSRRRMWEERILENGKRVKLPRLPWVIHESSPSTDLV
ncbi:MAG: CoA transferase [Gammaproteobacteria bacterium]|nr:CoA transferase [Gammaproteobacteria bacterium]